MAKIACCHNCVYSYCDHEHALWSMSVGVLTWPACANQPDSSGRMERVPERGICPNYRARLAQPEGDVKQIPLGHGFYAYVDAADYEWLSQWKWHFHGGYAVRYAKKGLIYMHREIAQPPEGMIVDHRNRNKMDNTRNNLRVCTRLENLQNTGKRRGTSSRFKGVGYHKKSKKWYARLDWQGEPFFLGYFEDEVDAARAYDHKAVELFGEFAHVNLPEEWPPERRQAVWARREEVAKEGRTRGAKRSTRGAQRKTPAAKPRATRGGDGSR